MRDYFASVGEMNSKVFLKGYQWPFDSRKVVGGSSIVDILVYIETVLKKRRVFLDFRRNPEGFRFEDLSEEAHTYLRKSEALLPLPIDRLRKMNPGAIDLYGDHGIDVTQAPLEIAVCAQHNNGGIAANHWWESISVSHLFPVGEVNGSHGVYRPGGSALNAGQVGAFRAAEYIVGRYADPEVPTEAAQALALAYLTEAARWSERCLTAARSWKKERQEFQARMSRAGAHIRSIPELEKALAEAWNQYHNLQTNGCGAKTPKALHEAFKNLQMCFAHAVYLDALLHQLKSGVGSRGSAIELDPRGEKVHPQLGDEWRIRTEDTAFREKVLETQATRDGRVENRWVARRPIPEEDSWFETTWAKFRNGEIYA
jgi:hypothetical protein